MFWRIYVVFSARKSVVGKVESHMGKRNQEFMLLLPPETLLIQAGKATGEYKINNKSYFI